MSHDRVDPNAETIDGPNRDTIPSETRSSSEGSESEPLVAIDPDNYAFGGVIGRGGVGVVTRVRDRRVGRDVALKELKSRDDAARRRFVREARITGQLEHPSIVPVYEVGSWPDGRPFYAMRLVGGRPLDVLCDEAKDEQTRLALIPRLLPAIEAIAYAHDQGVIHRDLKPANVLLGEFGETIVIDWGLARGIDEPDDTTEAPAARPASNIEAVRNDSRVTADGVVVGTPAYMAPEQAQGARLDARTDVYTLGALLYHALSGKPPHDGKTKMAAMQAASSELPTPLANLAPSAPADLIGIVEKAMSYDPKDRYPDAGALARDLEAFTTGRLVGAYRYTSWELFTRFVRRNRALSAAILTLFFVAILGAGAIISAERRAAQQERITHERLAQVHWREAVRRLQSGDHLAAEVLAAGALFEHPANPASPYDPLPTDTRLTVADRAERLAGPSATWLAARALRFASPARELIAHEDWVYDVLPIADGRTVITAGADRKLLAWDVSKGTVRFALDGHEDTVFQAATDAKETRLATSGYDGTVRLWSLEDGAPLRTINHLDDRVYGVCFAADGTLLAAGAGGRIVFVDPSSGELLDMLEVTSRIPWRLDCARDEPVAVLGTNGPEVVVIDVAKREVARRLAHPGASARGALLSTDGRSVLTADGRGVVRRFDRATGATLARAQLSGPIERLARSADGRWLAAASAGITILDGETLREVARLESHESTVNALAFARDGRRLYSGGDDHRVVEWTIGEAREGRSLLLPTEASIDVAQVSPNGKRLATGGDDRAVRVWDLATGSLLATWQAHASPVRGVLFLDDDRVLSSGMDRTLREHRLSTQQTRLIRALPHFGDQLSTLVDGRVAIGSGDGSVLFYDLEKDETQKLDQVHDGRTWWVGIDPGGNRLGTASFAGTIAIVDPKRARVVRKWRGHDARIYDAAWRPDGSELTTGGLDGWVRGWDPATGDRRRQWRTVDGEPVRSLAWSPDSRWLLLTTKVGMRLHRPDGTLEARLDLSADTRIATWTADNRMIFESGGRIFVLPLDTTSWRADPQALLRQAEKTSGATLDTLIGLGAANR